MRRPGGISGTLFEYTDQAEKQIAPGKTEQAFRGIDRKQKAASPCAEHSGAAQNVVNQCKMPEKDLYNRKGISAETEYGIGDGLNQGTGGKEHGLTGRLPTGSKNRT